MASLTHVPGATQVAVAAAAVAVVVAVIVWMAAQLLPPRARSAADGGGGALGCDAAFALYDVRGTNPCLAVRARIGSYETVFCVDTGFAGPCLLSLPCLALESTRPVPTSGGADDVARWCDDTQQRLGRERAPETRQQQALARFLSATRSSDFTSGCTMRLASIGATTEQTSEILLTPPLELYARPTASGERPDGLTASARACSGQPAGEILTSTPMATLHLLTCDWLLQNAPAMLSPVEGALRTNLRGAALEDARGGRPGAFHTVSTTLRGGAFVATVRVGGADMRVTVDTGAACYLSVGHTAAARIAQCASTGASMRQVGANGERICAQLLLAAVEMAGVAFAGVPVTVNDRDVDEEDGYAGVCLLRHFDMLLLPHGELLLRRNAFEFDAGLLSAIVSHTPCPDAPAMAQCTGARPAKRPGIT